MRRALLFLLLSLVLFPATAGAAAPNDPYWDQQWNLRVIRADRAWSTTKGSGIVVAVVDTGVDLGHPDLAGHLVQGADCVGSSSCVSSPGTGQDQHGHGTFMAGIVAAATGNGEGVASVAPLAKIMPVRALDANGSGNATWVANGIDWAVAQGANVINLSLAQERGTSISDSLLRNSAIDAAIKRAASAGRFVAIASGNNFTSGGAAQTAYNATVSGALVVGASTAQDQRAAYSNYGSGLDVVAPGGGSASNPDACDHESPIVSTWWSSGSSTIGLGCGTSMAVAHVSGIAAQLISKGYSGAGAADRIVATAVDLGTPGRDNDTGYGRVDAAAAVGASAAPPPAPAPKPAPKKSVPRPPAVGAAGPAATPASPAPPPPAPAVEPAPEIERAPEALLAAPPLTAGAAPDHRQRMTTIAGALALVVGLSNGLARIVARRRRAA